MSLFDLKFTTMLNPEDRAPGPFFGGWVIKAQILLTLFLNDLLLTFRKTEFSLCVSNVMISKLPTNSAVMVS